MRSGCFAFLDFFSLQLEPHIASSTVNMGVKLDLKKIALHAGNAEYNPKRFAAVIMRIRFEDLGRGAFVILIGS